MTSTDPGARDVVVIGAGHNGLVTACYLARAGLDVEVVERDTVVGGAVSTVERFPGYRMDRGSSAHIMVRHTGIVEDLDLASVGLTYQDLDPWGFHPVAGAPGGGIAFWRDLDRTCASVEAVCGTRDADAYRAFAHDWGRRNEHVFDHFQEPPTPGRTAYRMMRAGRHVPGPPLQSAREFLGSGDALLDATFSDERLKTALAWMGAQSGPPVHEPATADLVGWTAVMHSRSPGHPVGGSGMLAVALQRRLESYGGRVRLGDGAARVTVEHGRPSGVVTTSGEHVRARTVVAACHLWTTLDLLGDAAPAGLADRVRARTRTGGGLGMVVRLGTSALPHYPGAPDDVLRSMQLLAPSRLMMREAYGDFLAGRAPARPPALAMSFSSMDSTIAPPGKHNVVVWGQWHAARLTSSQDGGAGGETWDAVREREGRKLVAEVDAHAPGFADAVEVMHVQTPADLERELGLIDGQVMHLDMSLDQMFGFRPLPELAGYRVPDLPGLYLTGASTHPGGGVFGASGRSTARVVLADRRPSAPARLVRALKRRAGRSQDLADVSTLESSGDV